MKAISRVAGLLTFLLAPLTLPGCCSFAVAPAATPMIAGGGSRLVQVTTTAGCTWTYRSNAPWLTVSPNPDSTGQTGTGNGNVIVTAAPNQGATRRVGTATVAGQTITVDQAGTGPTGCTFQVSPGTLTFTGGGAGAGQFTISASAPDCGWTASRSSSLEDTVTLTGGGSGGSAEDRFGLGSATVTYRVKAQSPTSPWPSGGGDIVVKDAAQQAAATHHVALQ